MLKTTFRAAALVALAASVAVPLQAQHRGGHEHGRDEAGETHCMQAGRMLAHLTEALALTTEQVEAARPIVAEIQAKRAELTREHRGDPQAMHGVMLALHATLEERLGPMLTAEQISILGTPRTRMQQHDGCRAGG